MSEERSDQVRESQLRRTAAARRGVIAVGTFGALGTAVAVGVGQLTASLSSDDTGSTTHRTSVARHSTRVTRHSSRERNDDEHGSDEGHQQAKPRPRPSPQGGGGLVVQGNGGSPQGQSSGS